LEQLDACFVLVVQATHP